MSLDIKLGSYSFGNYIDTFEITHDSRVEQVAIPRRHGYLSDTGYKGGMSIRVGGMIYNDDYNTSRTHFNLLKNAFQLGKATLTIFSDRQVEVQKTSFSCSYEDQDLRRIRWEAELVSDDFGFVAVDPTVDLNSILTSPQTDIVINSGNLETDAVIRIQGGLNGISSGLRIDNLTSGKYFTYNQAIPGKTNVLKNSGFETWTGLTNIGTDTGFESWASATQLNDWNLIQGGTGGTVDREETEKRTGNYSAKITKSSTGNCVLARKTNPTVASVVGKTIVLGAWVKTANTHATGVFILLGSNGTDGKNVTAFASNANTAWQYISVVYSVPADATGLNVQLGVSSTTTAVAYFDDAIIYEQLAPTSWTLSGAGATVAREEGTVKVGTYSAKLTRNGANTYIFQDAWTALGGGTVPRGKSVSFGVWVNASVADKVTAYLWDGTTTAPATPLYHNGDSTWQYFSGTMTVGASATYLRLYLGVITTDTTAYFDGAFVVDDSEENYVDIDTDLLTVENQAGTNKLNYFSGDFFKLVAGNNSIKWTGAVDSPVTPYQQSIQFSYRSKYDGH